MLNFWIWNVTNAEYVIARGYKPQVQEVGPFGYKKKTYKYEVEFERGDENTISYKEYSLLEYIDDETVCERMYNKAEHNYLNTEDACAGGACYCRSDDSAITVVNPLFLRLIWQDSPHEMMALFSAEIYQKIILLLENDFMEAVSAHIISKALYEIVLFRTDMQLAYLLNTSYHYIADNEGHQYMLSVMSNQTFADSSYNKATYSECGLDVYSYRGVTGKGCPWLNYAFNYKNYLNAYITRPIKSYLSTSDEPSIDILMDSSYKYSILNFETGLPMWLAICWRYYKYSDLLETKIDFTTTGYTTISADEIDDVIDEITTDLAMSKTNNDPTLITDNIIEMSQVKIQGIALWLSAQWLKVYGRYPVKNTLIEQMLYYEFDNSTEPVICSPLGNKCLYQLGHMKKYYGMSSVSFTIVQAMTDLGKAVNSNPVSLYAEGNNPMNYNSNLYCKLIYHPNYEPTDCDDLYQTIYYGRDHMPAGFWGTDNDLDASNVTKLDIAYSKANKISQDKDYYLQINCNVSHLLIDIYRNHTDFHEEYMISYLNKFKDPTFNHQFTRQKLTEIAWAQFGGGFSTYALVQARTSYQILRLGMWYFRNADDYYIGLIEFSSWAILQGYHQAIIYDVDDAKTLLYALARRDEVGKKFRQHTIHTSTTLVGNGNNLQWGIGKVGEVAFTPESNLASFLWPSAEYGPYYDDNIAPSIILNEAYDSSGQMCQVIEDLYQLCILNIKQGSSWLVNCKTFQTSISDSSNGIACNYVKVMKNDHPYKKSRGNIVNQMLSSLTQDIKIKQGLWCATLSTCNFEWGGMFTTTTVRKLLFEGYTEPTVLRYLNQKYEDKNISFSCVEFPKDSCGHENLHCNDNGVYLNLPDGSKKKWLYGHTPLDEYFAPKLEIVENTGQLIWSHAMDSVTRDIAKTVKNDNTKNVIEVVNPFWAAYPAWQSNDPDFNKYYQCQKRVYGGPPNLFASCVTTIDSGTGSVDSAHNIIKFLGNASINHFADGKPLPVYGATEKNQFKPFKWSAFQTYPYTFQGTNGGDGHSILNTMTIFNKQHALSFLLSQKSFTFEWEAEVPLNMPIFDGFDNPANGSAPLLLAVRRFVEDEETWERLRTLGTPKDFYGMPYLVPKGMASLETLSGFQLFASTPHMYGNELWRGVEFSHVNGYEPQYFQQRTFVDYDAITGLGLRSVTRQQIVVKVERNPILTNIFSSQDRCVAPTNKYGGVGLGYGCYAYVPLFWFEDSRIIDTNDFYRKYDHFYSRPSRASTIQLIGIIISVFSVFFGICGYLYEHFHMTKFYKRVYID